jgi:hypothetical protein
MENKSAVSIRYSSEQGIAFARALNFEEAVFQLNLD